MALTFGCFAENSANIADVTQNMPLTTLFITNRHFILVLLKYVDTIKKEVKKAYSGGVLDFFYSYICW